MTTTYTLIVVEGPHDQAFVARVLTILGLRSFKDKPNHGREDLLDPFWEYWKPEIKKNRRLYESIFMPSLFADDSRSVAVVVAGGSGIFGPFASRLATKPEWVAKLAASAGALVLIADADMKPAAETFADLAAAYRPVLTGFPERPGEIVTLNLAAAAAALRVGAFILPNNADFGTVETVLLPVGRRHLAPLLDHAHAFVDGCEAPLKAHFAPFDSLKAIVAAAASILHPGATNTVSIENDAWITSDGIADPALSPFVDFLRVVLGLPPPASTVVPGDPDPLDLIQELP